MIPDNSYRMDHKNTLFFEIAICLGQTDQSVFCVEETDLTLPMSPEPSAIDSAIETFFLALTLQPDGVLLH